MDEEKLPACWIYPRPFSFQDGSQYVQSEFVLHRIYISQWQSVQYHLRMALSPGNFSCGDDGDIYCRNCYSTKYLDCVTQNQWDSRPHSNDISTQDVFRFGVKCQIKSNDISNPNVFSFGVECQINSNDISNPSVFSFGVKCQINSNDISNQKIFSFGVRGRAGSIGTALTASPTNFDDPNMCPKYTLDSEITSGTKPWSSSRRMRLIFLTKLLPKYYL